MTAERTSKEQVALIETLASASFKDHELEQHKDGSWRCGARHTVCHSFRVWFSPGMVVVWGDLGEFVLRVSDGDSLRWWMTATSRDYFLGKVRASDYPRREFMLGDAWAELGRQKREIVGEIEAELFEELGDAGQVGPPVNADDAADPHYNDDRLVAWRALSDAFADLLEDQELPEGQCWPLAHYRTGDSEWPDCEEWSSGMLWLWEACKTFRRLYRLTHLVDRIHKLRGRLADVDTEMQQAILNEEDASLLDDLSAARRLVVAELHEMEAEHAQARTEAAGGSPAVSLVPGDGGSPPRADGGPQPGNGVPDGPAEVQG